MMLVVDWREHIVIDPELLGGKPALKGTRLSVEFVLELMAAGWGREEMLEEYPTLTEQGVRAALAYAAEAMRTERVFPAPRSAA